MSTLRVEGIRNAAASSDAITLATDGTCTAKITNGLSNRRLNLNGAMLISQRGTSAAGYGFKSVDGFAVYYGGTDEIPTQEQVSLTSGGPFDVGFKKAFKLTNGNQTGGAGSDDSIEIQTSLEGQDINNSGWVASDPNSKLTISYWAKSSVAQTFYMRFRAFASSQYEYTYSVALSANTWTKVTKTIPGNSNFSSIVTTNAKGFFHSWALFNGTDQTNNKTLDQWAVKDNANKSPDCTATWYTTNDATFEITGVQLEVGDVATDFEHRTYGDELLRCQRYYNRVFDMNGQSPEKPISLAVYENGSTVTTIFNFPEMRAVPSLDITDGTDKFMIRRQDGSDSFNTMTLRYGTRTTAELTINSNVSGNSGVVGMLRGAASDTYIAFSAEM